MIEIGKSDDAWFWVATEPIHGQILGVYISRHRNTLVAESLLKSLIKIHGRHGVCSDGVSWYPEACDSPGLEHKLPSPFEKSIIERVLEYVKYTCIKEGLYETCLQLDSASTLKSEI